MPRSAATDRQANVVALVNTIGSAGDFLLVARLVDAAAGEFLGVVVVVLAHAHDVLGERADRRGELDAVEGDRRGVFQRRRSLVEEGDHLSQVANRRTVDQKLVELVVLDRSEDLPVPVVHGCDTHWSKIAFLEYPASPRKPVKREIMRRFRPAAGGAPFPVGL